MVTKILTTFSLIISLLLQNFFLLPAKPEEHVQMKAVLISDIHADADFTRDRTDLMREIFAAIGSTQNDADTLVMAGDLTNSGDLLEYTNLQNCLNAYCRISNRVPAFGNHDSWHHSDDPDFEKAESYFKDFCSWNGINTDKVYYTKCVNGIPFIVMGVEAGDFGDPYHSEEQLDWLEDELTKYVSLGQPVFVICHKQIKNLGKSAARINRILRLASMGAAAPIVFVSGHNHAIGDNTYAKFGRRLVYLNLPSVEYTEDGGLGFVAEVYEHNVVLRGMNFLLNEPLPDYEYILAY